MRYIMHHAKDKGCRVIAEPIEGNQYRVTFMKKRTGLFVIEYWSAAKIENNFIEMESKK